MTNFLSGGRITVLRYFRDIPQESKSIICSSAIQRLCWRGDNFIPIWSLSTLELTTDGRSSFPPSSSSSSSSSTTTKTPVMRRSCQWPVILVTSLLVDEYFLLGDWRLYTYSKAWVFVWTYSDNHLFWWALVMTIFSMHFLVPLHCWWAEPNICCWIIVGL